MNIIYRLREPLYLPPHADYVCVPPWFDSSPWHREPNAEIVPVEFHPIEVGGVHGMLRGDVRALCGEDVNPVVLAKAPIWPPQRAEETPK